MRVCPTLEGNAIPLISHRIGEDQCMARQCGNYHKCHRCVFRGRPAGWQPEETTIPAALATDTRRNGIKSAPALHAVAATGAASAAGKVASDDRPHRNGKLPVAASAGRLANTKTRSGAAAKRVAARNAAAE